MGPHVFGVKVDGVNDSEHLILCHPAPRPWTHKETCKRTRKHTGASKHQRRAVWQSTDEQYSVQPCPPPSNASNASNASHAGPTSNAGSEEQQRRLCVQFVALCRCQSHGIRGGGERRRREREEGEEGEEGEEREEREERVCVHMWVCV